ncbi:MAG: transporter ATP-binding protein [Cyanobacteria bacterium RYN_339]|nr:transporter ATP-binding protein [Cyanobacteria bacterium RYN_339]
MDPTSSPLAGEVAEPEGVFRPAAGPPPPAGTSPVKGEGVRLLRYLWPHGLALVGAALCVVANAACTMALVPLARQAAAAFGNLTSRDLNLVIGGLVGLYVLKSAFAFAQTALAQHVALAVTAGLREDAFRHLLELDLRFFARHRAADLSSRLVQDLGLVRDALAAAVADVVPAVAIVTYGLSYAVWLNWRLAAATFVGAPLVAWTIGAFGRRLHGLSDRSQARVSDIFVRAQETLAAISTVKAFGREDDEAARFAEANQQHRAALWAATQVAALQPAAIAVIQTTAIGGVLWVGGQEILAGRLAAADLIAFAAAIGVGIDPTLALAQAWGRLQAAGGALDRVKALFNAEERLPQPVSPAPLGVVAGAIRVNDVVFGYDRAVLHGIAFHAEPGEVVALVGASGGGKSTLASLLLRLYDPWEGAVTLDGRDLRSIANPELRRAIALVPQDPVLFTGTVAQNVAYARPDATRAEIEAACRTANAHGFIQDLTGGYEAQVGERGGALSGGQRQRLAIARALLADPRVLVLDEATSALDTEAAALIREALGRLMAGRTTIVIAHRLEQIQDADRVYVIEAGKVVEFGAPKELVAANGAFRRLLDAAGHDGKFG